MLMSTMLYSPNVNDLDPTAMYQFAHVNAYSLTTPKMRPKVKEGQKPPPPKPNVKQILDEATRRPGNCPHVKNPAPPTWLFGNRRIVEAAIDAYAKTPDPLGRKKRVDAQVLVAQVHSYPAHGQHYQQWRDELLKHLKKEYGNRLRGVVEHLDEPNPHLHVYIVPDPGQRMADIHPGIRAAEALKDRPKGEQNRAYCEAMREWQTRVHDEVSVAFGMSRIGPKRQRLTRGEHLAQKLVNEQIAKYVRAERFIEVDD